MISLFLYIFFFIEYYIDVLLFQSEWMVVCVFNDYNDYLIIIYLFYNYTVFKEND